VNQLGNLVAGDSVDLKRWKKTGRICHRNRSWLRLWLQSNPLTHLVQEFKVSAHDAPYFLFWPKSAEVRLLLSVRLLREETGTRRTAVKWASVLFNFLLPVKSRIQRNRFIRGMCTAAPVRSVSIAIPISITVPIAVAVESSQAVWDGRQ